MDKFSLERIDPSAEEALRRAQGGDPQAFALLVWRYEAMLTGYVRHLLSDQDGVADVVQESFLDLHRRLQTQESLPPFPGWLYRAATNNAIDASRRRGTRERVRERIGRGRSYAPDVAGEVTTRVAVVKALGRLILNERACVLLSSHLGLDYRDIAVVLQINLAAARQRITRAKRRFREEFEKEL